MPFSRHGVVGGACPSCLWAWVGAHPAHLRTNKHWQMHTWFSFTPEDKVVANSPIAPKQVFGLWEEATQSTCKLHNPPGGIQRREETSSFLWCSWYRLYTADRLAVKFSGTHIRFPITLSWRCKGGIRCSVCTACARPGRELRGKADASLTVATYK